MEVGALWARYSYEISLTLGAFTTFWVMHLVIRYLIGPLFKTKKSQIHFEVLIVSFFHCLSAVALASYVLFTAGEMHPLWDAHPISTIQFAISTGYFLWDMSLFTVYFDEFGLGMFFHAIITSTCFGMAMIPFIQRALTFFLLYELSTLFMDVVLFCRVIGKDSGLFYLANGIFFTIAFFVVRIIYGTRITIEFWAIWWREILSVPSTPFAWRAVVVHYILCSGGLMLLNFVWFAGILKEVKSTLLPSKPKTA